MSTARTTSSSLSIHRRSPAGLTAAERDELERFVTRFIAYPRERLDAALDQADYVWLCRDAEGALVGTTAVRALTLRLEGREVLVLYTSVVAVAPEHRRTGVIPKLGLRSYLLARARRPFASVYWLSLSASPSAYLQMARNFERFWPRPEAPTPPRERALLEASLAALGATRVEEFEGCLRLADDFGVSDREQHPSRWDRTDAHVDFFLRVNPGYVRGSDLACLCAVDFPSLLGSLARQLLRRAPRPRTPGRAVSDAPLSLLTPEVSP